MSADLKGGEIQVVSLRRGAVVSGLAAAEALAAPVLMAVWPETVTWLASHAWSIWCLAGGGVAAVGLGMAKRGEKIDNRGGFALDAGAAVTMGGLTAMAMVEVAEWSLSGHWAAGGWARAGEVVLATGLALGATYLLVGRQKARQEKARQETEVERMWQRRAVLGERSVRARAGLKALEAMAQIGAANGPVTEETETLIRSLALQVENGDANASGTLAEVVQAAVRSGPRVRVEMANETGVIDAQKARALGRGRGAVAQLAEYEKKRQRVEKRT